MVSAPVIAGLFVSTAALLIAPIVLVLVLCLRKKISPKPMFLGFAAFFVSQICLRLPILQALGKVSWYQAFAHQTVLYAVTICFTAGLFEESARYLCARFFLKRQRAFRDAIGFGLGHGFCEVILIAGLTELNLLIYAEMLNSGVLHSLASTLPEGSYQKLVTQLLALTPVTPYVAIWERFSAVLFHLFATVLIFRGINTGKVRYYFFAIAAHTLTDSASVLLMKYGNVWISESAICILSLLGIFYVWKVRPHWGTESVRVPAN